MFRSSGSDRYESKPNSKSGCCCIQEYEDEISILQQKLMQTHNKLILQLDVCQEQQLTIIDLTKKIMHLERQSMERNEQSVSFSSSKCDADVSRDSQEISKACFYQNKNYEFTLNNSNELLMSNYNSPTFIENNRNQLLKTDLQAMRIKLLQQATEKTNLQEELNQLKNIHNQKMNEYKKQIKDIQNDHEFLLKEYDYIKLSLDKGNMKRGNQKNFSSSQLIELNQKSMEFQRLYRKEIQLNQELNKKIVDLKTFISSQKDKIKNLQEEIEKYTHCVKSASTTADGLKEQRDREEICGTIRISKNPGTLWDRDSNRSKNSQNVPSTSDFLKKRNTLTDVNYGKEKYEQKKRQNKQNLHDSIPSIKSQGKERQSRTNKKDDYQSTKELIRKLQEAELITRQKKRPILA